MEQKTLLLIDGNSLAFRAFYAMHSQLEKMKNQDGLHTNSLVGFNNFLDALVEPMQPDFCLVAWDAGKKTFRTNKFDDYKGSRKSTPEELVEQFPYLREMVELHGIKSYELVGYEADDIIGTLAKHGSKDNYKVTIVTGDRDLVQLVDENITVLVTKKGVTQVDTYTPKTVVEKYDGLTANQIVDLKALTGDTTDNYPGVTKIGPVTATKLLKKWGTLDNLYDNIDKLKASKMKENLITDKSTAYMSQDLAKIRTEVDLPLKIDDIEYGGPKYDEIIEFYKKLNFKQQLAKLYANGHGIKEEDNKENDIKFTELTDQNIDLVNNLKGQVSFYIETTSNNYHRSEMVGFVIGNETGGYFVTRTIELLLVPQLKSILESQNIAKNVFNAKACFILLNRLGIKLVNVKTDILLAAYLLDTNVGVDDISDLAQAFEYYNIKSDALVYGKGAKFNIPSEDAVLFSHLTSKAKVISGLCSVLIEKLTDLKQLPLYEDIELPLTFVLADMEITGIKVNVDELKSQGSKMIEKLSELELSIYQKAGEEFNIQSPKQLGKILFEKMQLPVIKKTKTGYSTAVDVLEKLAPQAPIVEDILQYRQVAKLQQTYVEGLIKVIHEDDSKIHTRYMQTLTQTGRLSSVEPNLQNIPIRLEEGRKIRKAFIPSHDNWEIFGADYSQIELRVLAHMTADEHLQAAFLKDDDIHESTARRIFNLKQDQQVDGLMRRKAKAVNFGIVYGISDFGLSQSIHVSRNEAKEIIDTYFHKYPGVLAWIKQVVDNAKLDGYVETLSKRRRYLPDINSKKFNLRSFAERTAMNTPIQGSAADIIKLAMIKMQQALKDNNLKAKMLLQVHDELIFEAPSDEIEILNKLVPKIMDSAVSLDVPLKVENHHGITWYDAK